jgi:hypothetical protein
MEKSKIHLISNHGMDNEFTIKDFTKLVGKVVGHNGNIK